MKKETVLAKLAEMDRDQILQIVEIMLTKEEQYKKLLHMYEDEPNVVIAANLDSIVIEMGDLMKYDINQKMILRWKLQETIASFINSN